MQEHQQSSLFSQQKLETLSEDWNQINFLQHKLLDTEKNKFVLKNEETQTESFGNVFIFLIFF